MREVEVIVSLDGTTSSEFSGFAGPSCLAAAEQLRQLLAARFGIQSKQTSFLAKPELSQVQEVRERRREGEQHA